MLKRISLEQMQGLIEEIRNMYPELEQLLLFLAKDSAQTQLEADQRAYDNLQANWYVWMEESIKLQLAREK